jgi:hypothetical protein
MTKTQSISPEQLVSQVLCRINSMIIEAGRYEWEERLGHSLTAPFYYPDFCRTVGCPNSAILYPFCNECCRKSYGLEIRDVGGEVGVFACKQFKGGNYVTPLSLNVKNVSEPLGIYLNLSFLTAPRSMCRAMEVQSARRTCSGRSPCGSRPHVHCWYRRSTTCRVGKIRESEQASVQRVYLGKDRIGMGSVPKTGLFEPPAAV